MREYYIFYILSNAVSVNRFLSKLIDEYFINHFPINQHSRLVACKLFLCVISVVISPTSLLSNSQSASNDMRPPSQKLNTSFYFCIKSRLNMCKPNDVLRIWIQLLFNYIFSQFYETMLWECKNLFIWARGDKQNGQQKQYTYGHSHDLLKENYKCKG